MVEDEETVAFSFSEPAGIIKTVDRKIAVGEGFPEDFVELVFE